MVASVERFLTKLEPGVETAAGKVRGIAAALPTLIGAGWVETRKDGRVVLVGLTAAGAAHRAALPAPKPPAKKSTVTPAARLAALEAAVAALSARVAILETPAVAIEPAALRAVIVAIVSELDASQRLGGLVPIPEVRAELKRRGVAVGDAEVTNALEELERSWLIDLSVAQSPNAVRDRGAGIERAGRGLLYYVARR